MKAKKEEKYDVENTVIKIKNAYSEKLSVSVQKTPLLITIEYFDFNKDFFSFSWSGLNFFDSKTYRISDPNSHRKNLHLHDNFEIIYVIRGTSRVRFENHFVDIPHGCCMIINRNIAHIERPNESCDFVLISPSNHFLSTIIENDYVIFENNEIKRRNSQLYNGVLDEMSKDYSNIQYWLFEPTNDSAEIVSKVELKVAELISTMNQKKDGFYFHMQELLVQFFCILGQPSLYQNHAFFNSITRTESIFKEISNILEERNGLISRTELAEIMNYDDHHLNRIVQKTIGQSLIEYARYFTMKKSVKLLIETDMSIEEIMNELGFSNKTYFFKLFRELYGTTPKQYRKIFKNEDKN